MRILLVSSSSGSRGGGEIFLLYLGAELKAAGHTVALWCARHPRMDDLARQFASLGEVIRADYRNTYDHWHRGVWPTRSRATLEALRASWLEWRPDVVHLNKQNLEDGADLLLAAAALPVPHLCTIHITQSARFLGARLAGWRDARARRNLRAYRGPLVVVAPARVADLREFAGPVADIRVVNNGVSPAPAPETDRSALRVNEGLRANSLAFVAVARLEPQKCPLRFVDYAAQIRRAFPDAEFRWIGSGRLAAEWDRAVAERNLADVVRRSEWRSDVRRALPAFDLMLHPAAYEGLSLALLEAMAAGVPCAVTPAVHEQLPESLRACSIALQEPVDWQTLLRDRSRLAALGRSAREVVAAEFSTAAMARAYIALYRELCAQR